MTKIIFELSCIKSQLPQQIVPLGQTHFPCPLLIPASNDPSQMPPSYQIYFPQPSGFPNLQLPVQRSPFANYYQPFPCFKKFQNYPLQVLFLCLKVPSPCCLLLYHSPSYESPFGDLHIPNPHLTPFFQFPSNFQPLFHQKVPYPYLFPFKKLPLQIPSIFLQQPFILTLFQQHPQKIYFSVTLIPLPTLISSLYSPKKTPYYYQTIVNNGFLTSSFKLNDFLSKTLQLLRYVAYYFVEGTLNVPFDFVDLAWLVFSCSTSLTFNFINYVVLFPKPLIRHPDSEREEVDCLDCASFFYLFLFQILLYKFYSSSPLSFSSLLYYQLIQYLLFCAPDSFLYLLKFVFYRTQVLIFDSR